MALLWGLGAMTVFIAMAAGWRLLSADPLGHLAAEDRGLVKDQARRRRGVNPLTRFGEAAGPSISGMLGEPYRNAITKRVMYAQRPDLSSAADFFAMKARMLLIVTVGAVGIFIITRSVIFSVLLLALGFFLPDLLLLAAGQKRQAEIERELPDFLDILAVTVSAGLSFRGALQRVIERTDGPLASEMRTTMQQMDVGTPRYDAFRSLRDRTRSEAMDAFVTSMMQAEELGAPLVEALDQIAEDMRRARAQRARQEAAKASPKIASVVTFVMVPATMVIVLVSMYFISGIDFGEMFGSVG